MDSVDRNVTSAGNNYVPKPNSLGEKIGAEIIKQLGTSAIETLKEGGLTSRQLDQIHAKLEMMAEEGDKLFGTTFDPSDTKVQEFLNDKMTDLFASVLDTVKSQGPDLIREASLSEAVFSHKGDYRPILATDSLATCIGVAGYDPANEFGFVIHFPDQREIHASGNMLLDRIGSYREKHANAPLLIHLRGGIRDMSESLLKEVKDWLASSGIFHIIASEDTLQTSIIPGGGIPQVPGTLKLDVRTGTCETYDYTINPYSKFENKRNIEELNKPGAINKIIFDVATKKPEIKVVYDAKANA